MTFYTANLFFGDSSVAKRRHFNTTHLMHNRIIENWNSIITPDDEVYILGGVGEFEFLSSLNGEITVFMSEYERGFYDKYIDSVTDCKDDPYNKEMFDTYVRSMFYVNKVQYHNSIIKRDYSGSLIRLAIGREAIIKSSQFVVAGGIGDYQRMFKNGINADIYVNGMFPLTEVSVRGLVSHIKEII